MNLLTASRNDLKKAVSERSLKACVVGLGYVGLPLCVVLGENGFIVTGVDKDQRVIEKCEQGSAPFYEKGLDERLTKLIQRGMVNFSKDISAVVHDSSVIFAAVGSPLASDGKIDLTAIKEVMTAIGKGLTKGKLVITKSTLLVGGTRKIVKPILEDVSGLVAEQDFGLAFVPERTVEGEALEELVKLPKIVAGVGKRSRKTAQTVLAFIGGPIVPVSCIEVAEAAKLFDNIYRDVNIALANELAINCERLGVDAIEAIKAANHRYHRTNILTPGVGVGGSCLTKDPYIFTQTSIRKNNHPSLILQSRQINDSMTQHFMSLIKDAFLEMKKELSGSNIAVLGYAFKGGTSDTRKTPAKKLVQWLKKENALVRLYDPFVSNETTQREVGVRIANSLDEAVQGADAICIVTDHDEFLNLDLSRLRSYCQNPSAIIDGRHIVKPQAALSQQFIFRGIGRPHRCFEGNK